MVIIFDMRTGAIMDRTEATPNARAGDRHDRVTPPRVTTALECVLHEPASATQPIPNPLLMGCYFDESGD